MTQKAFAEKLQLFGIDTDRLTIQRIESGKRFVADYEAKYLSQALGVSLDELFDE